jgi:hypothetical protein
MRWNPAGVELMFCFVLAIVIGLSTGITWLWVVGLVLMFLHGVYSSIQ